ncbi:RnfH family protein [Rhodanobacter sp. L36]|uniref:RnfH family protein n=1 Tax=Rhodanobacter sp. L36 TaxID=1747221 RepID=UPI00131B3C73|nr:RnfH family protein [Rhodanobacter sp. L36]
MVEQMICVELIYAEPDNQTVLRVQLPKYSTVADAIRLSNIAQRFAPDGPLRSQLGIFGKKVSPERVLKDGDRVEIYRLLECDPMEARRRRARDS